MKIFKHAFVLNFILLFAMVTSAFFLDVDTSVKALPSEEDIFEFEGTYDWEVTPDSQGTSSDYITYDDYRDNYCTASSTASQCTTAASGKYIRFDTAEQLYRWSLDVSFEEIYITGVPAEDVKLSDDVIDAILDLDFVLGTDIDYSVMTSKAFIPIGYEFTDLDEVEYTRALTGTFNGQGFEIQNLYVAGYEYLVYVDYTELELPVDIAMSEYYSMINYNEGTIYNLGFVDGNLEILTLHPEITYLANLVGCNTSTGSVYNVYVEDTRTDVTEAGMRYNVGTSSTDFEAAGIMHTNEGSFNNSYYASKVVINGNYINKFSVQPVLYTNTGTTPTGLVFDQELYEEVVYVNGSYITVDTPNGYATGETTNTIKSSSSSLNSAGTWYFYPSDTYPLLKGFDYDSVDDVYEISSPTDLVFLPEAMTYTTIGSTGSSFASSDYVLTASLDMGTLAEDAYQIPTVTFTGSLSGYNSAGSDLGDNYYIYNLDISENIIRGTGYYAGLFSILGAGSEVSNLNFTQSTINYTDTDGSYNYTFYMGALAGRLVGGTISDCLVDVDLDMGTESIGLSYTGGVVGIASGVIERVSSFGDIEAGNHTFTSGYSIKSTYNIGGIVGAASGAVLTMDDAVNHGTINGFQTSSDITLATGYTQITVRLGGVIGYINNATSTINQLIGVANHGDIYIDSVKDSVSVPSYQYAGGVFGELEGLAPVLEYDDEYLFANLYNSGDIYHSYTADTADVRAAGIGINDASQAIEYALLYNHGTYDFTEGSATYTQTQFDYAALIYDIASSAVTLSRCYNYGDFDFDSNVYDDISGIYYSVNNNATTLRYVANYGDFTYMDTSQISLAADLYISAITRNTNVNYTNVYNYGDITVVNLNLGSYDLFISGITTQLTSGKYIKNSLNDGDIIFAELSGSGNIYIGGLVNTNFSGDLQDPGQSETQPTATIGIINSVNSGNITTSYGLEAAGLYGVLGTSNTFIGGIATLNSGSIQNAANLGNISAYNGYSSSTFTFETSTYFAGLVTAYNSGIAAGGVSAVAISGDSYIYDSANNGNVLVTANKYVRAGGVLGVALYDEAEAGGITTGMGLSNDIEDSVLSNGLNFGNISALSNTIASYTLTTLNTSFAIRYGSGSSYLSGDTVYISTVNGNSERPTIYSSAGGVIGYGLSVMQRMLNHGTISATDVAGGVVGATYVLGGSSTTTTTVNITTAINYGDIKAVANTSVSSINKHSMSYTEIESYFMSDGNSFLFPSNASPEAPGSKRGFGGIFGRLQRGLNGVMTSENGAFDFIVNANENIDLIGRLDQVDNFSSSSRYFRFNDAIYYSAKDDDTTQVVFTGFYLLVEEVTSISGTRRDWDIYYDEVMFEQVGIVMTEGETVSTNNYFNNTTAYFQPYDPGDYMGAAYDGPITVPWITEDPNDPDITNSAEEYIYDTSFPMRTDPDLTEYIYFMPNDLLADRFTISRPNGMYVLSTSAGQSYGSVIPKNIDITYIRMIDEDYTGFISLFMDYTLVSPIYKEALATSIEDAYDDLKQTSFNDKAELIPNDTIFVTIEEINGSNTILSNPTVDYINKTVTFSISMEAYGSSQTSATYEVTNGLTSSYALIAQRAEDYYGHTPSSTELQAYNNLLYPEKDLAISTNYPADLSVTLPSYSITSNVTLSIGYFTVYSEAFIGDDLYASDTYYTDYHCYIEFTPNLDNSPGTTQIETVAFNGGGSVPASGTTDVRSQGDVNALGSITLNYEDTKGVFTQGYDFSDNFVVKYYDGTILDESYYSISTSPVNIVMGVGYYSITFTFVDLSRTGDYYFEYSYFPTSTVYTCYFDKAAASASSILDFTYYSENGSIEFVGNTITSYVNIGTEIDMDTSTTNFSSSVDPGALSYESDTTYDIDFMTAGTLELSPFAEIVSARLVQMTITNGYKTYQMEYIVEAENGYTQTVYTHYLIERTVNLTSVLKDGNEVELENVYAVREAELTTFTVDLGFDQNLNLYVIEPGAYSYLEISVSGTTNDGLTTYLPEEIVGITYDSNGYLLIYMDITTLPGIYTFSFVYYRDGSPTDYVTFASDLVITKNLGTDAYLSDIEFSEYAGETTYPDISIVDSSGDPMSSSYDPVVYFGGIDYDGADEAEWPYFRIDGYVTNVPLDEYVPYFLDYMPYGSTISRYAYDSDLETWYWTTEADSDSSSAVLAELVTDYTIFPDTLQEPEEGEAVVVLFRVTAEDQLTQVFYYITVTDVTYNLSILFDIYFCTDETQGSCSLANESVDFNDEMVIITIKNIDTNGVDPENPVNNPADFPTFSAVEALNNKMTQFFYTGNSDYTYKFGRNMSGAYTFVIELPLDEYLNDLYTYDIQFNEYYLNDASNYVSDLEGKYFYIIYSTANRTRRFNVYIREIESPETDSPFGLFEFFKSWFEGD